MLSLKLLHQQTVQDLLKSCIFELKEKIRVTLLLESMQTEEFFEAIRTGNTARVSAFLQDVPSLTNLKDSRGSTPLLLATYYGHKDVTEIILNSNPDVNIKDASGNTALMGVCFKGHTDIARLLIENGADVNLFNGNKGTALIYAATFGKADIVELLLSNNADPNLKDANGLTALDHARMQKIKDVVAILEKHDS